MQVVVGILRNADQKVLIAQRPQDTYKGGMWEFPGGKVENNESLLDALRRELREEIGIEVLAAKPWLVTQYDYGDRVVSLNTWLIEQFAGEPQGVENQRICWVEVGGLGQFEFPEGNREILESLRRLMWGGQ